ncbi:MAG: regulatory iron-sulfur-containing complex subunit RicT [candidate division SR1 bacterium]|nr:regulatory iron-sulfur-containing complex subunit RicT [candidate division SR1 bacterium]
MKKNIYVLDRYTNKNVLVKDVPEESFAKLRAGTKVVYSSTDQTGVSKQTVGTYIGHETVTDRQGIFQKILEDEDKTFFDEQQSLALDIFPLFKKSFKKYFPDSVPVTARYQIFGDQLYFYFYSEERYVFTDFVKEFRQELGKNIFLFQVGARDMVKMSPGTDCLVGCNGINLCCKSSRPLPSVEIENIVLQNLEGRDIERLKGRCGKLKCSLIYELETYVQESKKFPAKGSHVETEGCETCGVALSFNIMNGDVTIRTKEGPIVKIPYTLIKNVKLPGKQEESTKEVGKIDNKDAPKHVAPAKK